MAMIQLNALRLNAVDANIIALDGVRRRGSHAGAPPVVPDVPDIPEEPDEPTNPDVDENGYIIFEDAEVARICAENWGDGTGITMEQAAAVTDIGTVFKGNASIEKFDEFVHFVGVTNLGTSAYAAQGFYGCSSLESVTLPRSLELVSATAFQNTTSLMRVVNLDVVKRIGSYAFAESGLGGELNLPYLEDIAEGAFRGTKITKVSSLGKIVNLGRVTGNINSESFGLFSNCQNLEEVLLPDSVTGIMRYCFYNCINLRRITLPSSLTALKAYTFYGCTNLVIDELRLPNLKQMEQAVFEKAGGIKNITQLGDITSIPSGVNYERSRAFGDKSVCENIVLPDTLTTIDYYVLFDYTKMEVTLPVNLEKVGRYNFYNMPMTVDVNLPNLTSLGRHSLSYIKSRRVLSLGKVTTLDSSWNDLTLCNNSELELVVLPDTLTAMNNGYILRDCPKLVTLICKASAPPTLSNRCFSSSPIANGSGQIYVPDASVAAYREASVWSSYASRIFPVSQLQTDNPDLYAEIEEYL